MAKRKLTSIQRQYRKERRRIQNAIKRLEKQGYVLPGDLLPSVPKKVTQASINRLKKITTEAIYKKSVRLDAETGEIIPGIVARDKARSQRAKESARRRAFKQEYLSSEVYTEPPKYTTFPSGADIIINNFRSDVIGRFPESAGPILNRWLDGLLALYGKEDVADMLETAAANGVLIDYKVAYNTEALMGAIADFMNYLDTTTGADTIINNFRSNVIGRFPESAGAILNRWLDGLLAQQDKEDVANMLETAVANGVVIDYKVAYNTEALMGAIADFMDYLDTTSGFKQDLLDALEFEEDWEFPD